MLKKLVAGFVGHLKPDRATERSLATMQLPPPLREGGLPLMDALARRRSQREFSPTPLPPQELSNLLWAAFGINRPDSGNRTAPSALNAQEIDVYVAMASGIYTYRAKDHQLCLVADLDARRISGYQDFVDVAPLDLIYVADAAHAPTSLQDRERFACISAGAIAENVYLYCASAGLATVVRALFNRAALGEALRLKPDERIVLTQTVGYASAPRRL